MIAVRRIHRIDQLLAEHQVLVERAGGAEQVRIEQALDRRALDVAGRRRVPGDPEARQGGLVPVDLRVPALSLLRLDGNARRIEPALPTPVRLPDLRERGLLVEVAGDEDGRVVWRVIATEELARVLVARRHVLDVLRVADDGMRVRVPRERGLHQLLEHLLLGVAGALQVLAEDGAGLGAERGLVVIEVLEAIGLVLDDGRQRFRRTVEVVDGHVLAGERVGVQAEARDRLVVLLRRMLLRSAEHHVLEEVRVSGPAFLHFVAAADAHQRVVGDQSRGLVGDEDDPQAIRERMHLHREGERLLGSGRGCCGGRDQRGQERNHHESSEGRAS